MGTANQKARQSFSAMLGDLAGLLLAVALLPILVPFALVVLVGRWLKRARLKREFRRTWARKGKVGIFVHSDSPRWKEHIEAEILPHVEDRLVLLNWSKRSTWPQLKPIEVRVFEHWGGTREFNPLGIVIPAHGRVQIIRFWRAFKQLKHGKPQELRQQEERLRGILDASPEA